MLRQKLKPMRPMSNFTAVSDTTDAVSQPKKIPNNPAGTRIFRLATSKLLRYSHIPTMSDTTKMGSNNTAALTGDITKDNRGTPSMPMEDKPPLDSPTQKAARLAKMR